MLLSWLKNLKNHIIKTWKNKGKIIATLASLVAIIAFLTGSGSLPKLIASLFTNPTPTPRSTVVPTITTPPLIDFAPTCDSVTDNPVWKIPDDLKTNTNIQCPSGQGMKMVPSPTIEQAEIDLIQVNGKSYKQTGFDVKITVTFDGDKTHSNTMAGLVVQTPQKGSGGYGLAINTTGYWELINNNAQRQANGGVTQSNSFTLELKVQQGELYGLINGSQIFAYTDVFNPSQDAIGLVIYGRNSPLSSVYFSDFALDL